MDDFTISALGSNFSATNRLDPFGNSFGAGATGGSKPVPETSFADIVAQTGKDFVQSVQKAEQTSVAGIKGEAGVYEVATAVMDAEQKLRMMTAIRDRVVQAYQDISRMQI